MNPCRLLVPCLFLSSALLFGETALVVSATDLPPLGGPALEGNGVLGRMVSEALKGRGYRITFEYMPFARIVTSLQNRALQAAFFNRVQASEKDYFVEPILRTSVVFFYKKAQFPGGLTFTDLRELSSYRIGVVRGAPTIPLLENAGIHPDLAADELQDFRKLQSDRVDLVSTLDLFGWHALGQIGANPDDYGISASVVVVESCFLLSRSIPNAQTIQRDFLAGLDAAKKNNQLKRILESVYGSNRVPEYAIP